MLNFPSKKNTHSRNNRRTGSRLARRKQKQMLWQSVFLVVLSIGLALGFFIYVLPSSVNLFFKFLDSGEVISKPQALPPQVPILSAPPEAVKDETVVINGFAQVENEVVLLLNGQEHARQEVADDGTFEFEVKLSLGENSVAAYAINEVQEESNKSREYQIIYDNQPADIKIEYPANNAEIVGKDEQTIFVRGMAEPKAKLYLNERLSYADSEGNFEISHRLEEGENKLTLKAIDQAGNESETELLVKFRL